MKLSITILFTLFLFATSVAQDKSIPFDKKLFKEQKDEFKDAKNALDEGDAIYIQGDYAWPKAIEFYEKANAFNPNNADLNYKLGNCYMKSLTKSKALECFKKAYELNPTIAKDIHLKMGEGYQLAYEFDKAKYEYNLFRRTLNNNTDAEIIIYVQKKIDDCNTAIELVANPERVWIDNLGAKVNSKFPEYSPMITADESVIMFTTRRDDGVGDDIDPSDGKFMEDIYFSEKDKDGNWTKAKGIGENINTKSHDATSGFSNDGLTLFIYYGRYGMGDIYVSHKEEDGWTKAKSVGKNINGKNSHETSACMTFDKKELYFSSNRDDGKGGHDIWKCKWDDEKEEWGKATNVGDIINTNGDEIGVFLHPDGQTMYFSSNGHKGMGGYDIYYSTKDENGNWTEPVNIGYPISTTDDDVHFAISASGKHGYYASFNEGGQGEKDLYMITFLGPEKQPLLSSEDNLLASVAAPVKEEIKQPKVKVSAKNLSIMKGLVLDAETKKPVKAFLELVDNGSQAKIMELNNDAQSGKFLMSLPAGKNYGIAVKADGYLFHSENFDIPADAGFKEYEKVIYLKKIKKGESIVLRNIFFDTDKYSLKPESKTELERLLTLLEDNPDLRIEISGHTDTHGSSTYNQRLSEDRAKAVVDYLVAAGLPRERFEYKGYGEAKPLISDAERDKMKTKEQRDEADARNRRTEFKIL